MRSRLRNASRVICQSGNGGGDSCRPCAMKTLTSPLSHGFQRSHHVVAVARRRLEAEMRFRAGRGIPGSGISVMPTVRSPCTLECPRTGAEPGAVAGRHCRAAGPDWRAAARCCGAAPVLGDAHAVHKDGASALHVDLRGLFDRRACRPERRSMSSHEVARISAARASIAGGVAADEVPVQKSRSHPRRAAFVGFDQHLHEAFERRATSPPTRT